MHHETYHIKGLLFLVILYSASISGSDDFVLFDLLDGNFIRKCFMR